MRCKTFFSFTSPLFTYPQKNKSVPCFCPDDPLLAYRL